MGGRSTLTARVWQARGVELLAAFCPSLAKGPHFGTFLHLFSQKVQHFAPPEHLAAASGASWRIRPAISPHDPGAAIHRSVGVVGMSGAFSRHSWSEYATSLVCCSCGCWSSRRTGLVPDASEIETGATIGSVIKQSGQELILSFLEQMFVDF